MKKLFSLLIVLSFFFMVPKCYAWGTPYNPYSPKLNNSNTPYNPYKYGYPKPYYNYTPPKYQNFRHKYHSPQHRLHIYGGYGTYYYKRF